MIAAYRAGGHQPGLGERAYTLPFRKVAFDGASYFVPNYATHRPPARALAEGRHFEPATHVLVRGILQRFPGSMIHAGTWFGPMLPSFAASCPGTVFAFEPVLDSYVMAKLTVEANALANVVLINAGLSERFAVGFVNVGAGERFIRGGRATIERDGQTVALMPIDAVAAPDLTLIQLDVEGHEAQALAGATATLCEGRPVVLAEDNARSAATVLAPYGYRHAGNIPSLRCFATEERFAEVVRLVESANAQS